MALSRVPKKQLDSSLKADGDDAADLGSGAAGSGTVLTSDGVGGTSFDAPVGSVLPVDDNTAVVKGSVDPTKLVRIDADGLTAATTRVLTMPDADITPDDASASRTPSSHVASHSNGGSDEIAVENLATGSVDVSTALRPDGVGGLALSDVSHGDLTGIGIDDHHARDHAASHSDAGSDEITVQNLGSTGASLDEVLKADGAGGLSFGAPSAVFIRRVGGTGADFAFDDLDGALAAFEASTAKECTLLIGASGVVADGSPVTITKGPVSFKGTVVGASVAISGANAVTFDLADTDQSPVTFENCDISKAVGAGEWIFTQSGSLRLINSTIDNISGADTGLFRQVAIAGTLKVFARNCTFTAAQDTATDSPVFLSLATSGTGLELHLDNCTYVRDSSNPTSFLKCVSANVRFVLENHTVLFGPRVKTTTFSIQYDGTSLMVDDKNNTGTATVHGEAAYSTRMDALSGVDIEIFEDVAADGRKFVGETLHILPGTYTHPATGVSTWENLAGRTIYGDGKSTKIIFDQAFTGNRIDITGSGNAGLVIRGIFFELQANLGAANTFFSIATSDQIRFEGCTFGNTGGNFDEFCLTFSDSADECIVRNCEFSWVGDLSGIDVLDSTSSSFYNNTFLVKAQTGMSLGANADKNYVFGNHFERRGTGTGVRSINILSGADQNIVANNYVGLASSSGAGIQINTGATSNSVIGNHGQDRTNSVIRNVDFTGTPNSDQATPNIVFDPANMGRIATVIVGENEQYTDFNEGVQQLEQLHHQSYGAIFVFVRGSTPMGTVGGDTRRDLFIFGVSDDAKIAFGTIDFGLSFTGSSASRRLIQITDCDLERTVANSAAFDSTVGLDVRLKNCSIVDSSSTPKSIFESGIDNMNVECEDCTFLTTNSGGGAIFENESVASGIYTFKHCTALDANTGELILHSNGTPPAATIRILERTNFGDVPVILGAGTVTIDHDGTGRWDETSLTSGTITRTGHQFSTDEVATGTSWITGSEIFRKVINTGALLNAAPNTTAHGITGLDQVISLRGFAENTGGNQIPLPHNDVAAVSGGDVGIHVTDTNIVIDTVGDATVFDKSHVELWYTKT